MSEKEPQFNKDVDALNTFARRYQEESEQNLANAQDTYDRYDDDDEGSLREDVDEAEKDVEAANEHVKTIYDKYKDTLHQNALEEDRARSEESTKQ